jgi:putative glutamine amidotransferase
VSPSRPFVAVAAYHLAEDRVPRWPQGGYGVPGPYVDRARVAGARTAILAPGEPGDPTEILAPFDALLLVGGGDVDPARYGAEPGDALYGVEPDRDAFEIDLVRGAVRAGLPTLCICRGMQVLNVAFGGTLHQHLPGMPGLLAHGVPLEAAESTHDVEVEDGTLLRAAAGAASLVCSSHHHQGVDRVGEGLRVSGRSSDGLVEALEPPEGAPGWTVAVQWHPEDTAETDPAQQGLFDELVRRAAHRARGAS